MAKRTPQMRSYGPGSRRRGSAPASRALGVARSQAAGNQAAPLENIRRATIRLRRSSGPSAIGFVIGRKRMRVTAAPNVSGARFFLRTTQDVSAVPTTWFVLNGNREERTPQVLPPLEDFHLREDGSFLLREDGSQSLRE